MCELIQTELNPSGLRMRGQEKNSSFGQDICWFKWIPCWFLWRLATRGNLSEVCGLRGIRSRDGPPNYLIVFLPAVGDFIFMNLINGQPGVGLITGKFFLTDSKKGEKCFHPKKTKDAIIYMLRGFVTHLAFLSALAIYIWVHNLT